MRHFMSLFFCFAALPVWAGCDGTGFLDRITAEERATLDAITSAMPYGDHLAYTATRGDQHITLIGTIHIYDPGLEAISARFAGAVADADLLLVEAGPEEIAQLEGYMADNPDIMFLNDGPTLPELLDETRWQQLADAARARQIPSFMAAKMQPWFLSMSLSIPPCAMTDMMAGREGLDFMLMNVAEDMGVPIAALEPWSLVIELLRSGTLEEQIAALEMGLLPVDVQDGVVVSMMDSFLAGETARAWALSRIALNYVPGLDPTIAAAQFDETEKLLLTDRNLNWIPVMTEAMQTADRVVVAVGAAHLPGETGVLRLLEAEGWQIAPL